VTKEEIEKKVRVGGERHCYGCGFSLPLTDFYIKRTKDNLNSYRFNSPCRSCSNIRTVERIRYQREYMLYLKYKLSLGGYNKLLESQDNKCAVCKLDQSFFKKNFAVDHNHDTGEIRGLLCTNCNQGLGLFMDNIDLLGCAIKYLKT